LTESDQGRLQGCLSRSSQWCFLLERVITAGNQCGGWLEHPCGWECVCPWCPLRWRHSLCPRLLFSWVCKLLVRQPQLRLTTQDSPRVREVLQSNGCY